MPKITVTNFPSPEVAAAFAAGINWVNDSAITIVEVTDTTVVFNDRDQDEDYTTEYLP